MSESSQAKFNAELADMLKEANKQGHPRKSIVSSELHARVFNYEPVPPNKRRMPIACIAMFRLALYQRGKAKYIGKLPNGATSTLEIEFDTADLPE